MKRLLLVATWLLAVCDPVPAADTIETFDPGAGDVELASQLEGVGRAGTDQALGSAMLLGYGLAERFSAYVASSLSADGSLAGAQTELNLGAFGTPLDTDHLDLDLILDLILAGTGMGGWTVAPALELNLDREPDLAAYGLYLRAAAAIAPRAAGPERAGGRQLDLGLSLGSYWSPSPRAQLLLEVDATVHEEPDPGAPALERGAVALGLNLLLGENLELITETRYDLPQRGEVGSAGFMVGVIATLPGLAY
jgi:hypothetical protein